jgi:hypothetical protein
MMGYGVVHSRPQISAEAINPPGTALQAVKGMHCTQWKDVFGFGGQIDTVPFSKAN